MATDNKKTKSTTTKNTTKTTTNKKAATKKSATTKTAPAKKTKTTTSKKASSPKSTAVVQSKTDTKKTATKKATPKKPTTKKTATKTKTTSSPKTTKKTAPKTVKPTKNGTITLEETTPEIVKELHNTEEIVTPVLEQTANNDDTGITSLLGAKLPVEKTVEAKKARKRHYIKDALFIATLVSILDLLAMLFIKGYPQLIETTPWLSYTVTIAIEFIFIFAFTYWLDYVTTEKAIQKNN